MPRKQMSSQRCGVPAPFQGRDTARMPFSRHHNEPNLGQTYSFKPKRGVRKSVSAGDVDAVPTDWTAARRRISEEEGTCRRLVGANEAIERQRILRLMQGRFPEGSISFMESEERGERLLASKDYAGAYVCFSRAVRRNNHSRIAYYKRAVCGWNLMLYDECIEDCRKALDVDLELLTILCRSLLLRERYQEAHEWYTYAVQELAPLESDPYNIKWRAECAAIPALQRFCSCIRSKKWEECLRLKDAAKILIDATPLVVQEARALLHVSPPKARLRLMSYVPTIARPCCTGSDVSLEEKAAWRFVEEHYLQASVLLAQASVYCGSEFLEFAAALVQTCLNTNPRFRPALLLGHYLVSLEEVLTRVAFLFAEERHTEAISFIDDGLLLDKSNRHMCSTLRCLRAEAHARLGKHLDVISDCTAAIDMNARCAKAFLLRAEAYRQTNQRAEAAVDRLAAVRLDPALRHILRGDEEQFLPQPGTPGPSRGRPEPQRRRPRWYDAFATSNEIPSAPKSPQGEAPSRPSGLSTRRAEETLYDILELRPGAAVSDVRAQFKKLTLLYHPDRLVRENVEAQQAALERFKLINQAHEVLSDPREKSVYDISLGIRNSVSL